MKNTELLFEFPVIIYDQWELNRAKKKEEDLYSDEKVDVPYAVGKAKIQPNEIKGYYQGYTRDKNMDELAGGDFNCTAILTHTGDFMCAWPIKKFEEMYEAHMERLQKYLDREREKEMELMNSRVGNNSLLDGND